MLPHEDGTQAGHEKRLHRCQMGELVDIVEPSSQLLTMEFLISLAIEETGA